MTNKATFFFPCWTLPPFATLIGLVELGSGPLFNKWSSQSLIHSAGQAETIGRAARWWNKLTSAPGSHPSLLCWGLICAALVNKFPWNEKTSSFGIEGWVKATGLDFVILKNVFKIPKTRLVAFALQPSRLWWSGWLGTFTDTLHPLLYLCDVTKGTAPDRWCRSEVF